MSWNVKFYIIYIQPHINWTDDGLILVFTSFPSVHDVETKLCKDSVSFNRKLNNTFFTFHLDAACFADEYEPKKIAISKLTKHGPYLLIKPTINRWRKKPFGPMSYNGRPCELYIHQSLMQAKQRANV